MRFSVFTEFRFYVFVQPLKSPVRRVRPARCCCCCPAQALLLGDTEGEGEALAGLAVRDGRSAAVDWMMERVLL
jgi:hypothetical protein